MTEPSEYITGRTIQEQILELIDYIDVRATEIANNIVASEVQNEVAAQLPGAIAGLAVDLTSAQTVSGVKTFSNGIVGNVTGNVTGNADTATTAGKLGSSTVGSTTKPIYLNGGTATICNEMCDLGSAQTITGVKTFSINKNNYTMKLKSSDVGRSDSVSGFTRLNQMELVDKNDASTGYIQNYLDGNGNVVTNYGTVSPNGTNRGLRVIAGDSTGYVTAPNRTYSAGNTTDVVNVAMLQASTDVVHTSGNETRSGVLTFSTSTPIKIGTGAIHSEDGVLLRTNDNSRFMTIYDSNGNTATLHLRLYSDNSVRLVLYKNIGGTETNTTIATL